MDIIEVELERLIGTKPRKKTSLNNMAKAAKYMAKNKIEINSRSLASHIKSEYGSTPSSDVSIRKDMVLNNFLKYLKKYINSPKNESISDVDPFLAMEDLEKKFSPSELAQQLYLKEQESKNYKRQLDEIKNFTSKMTLNHHSFNCREDISSELMELLELLKINLSLVIEITKTGFIFRDSHNQIEFHLLSENLINFIEVRS